MSYIPPGVEPPTEQEIQYYSKNEYSGCCNECVKGLIINNIKLEHEQNVRYIVTNDVIYYEGYIIHTNKESYTCKTCNRMWGDKQLVIYNNIYYEKLGPILNKANYSKVERDDISNILSYKFITRPEIGNALLYLSYAASTDTYNLIYFDHVCEKIQKNVPRLSTGEIVTLAKTINNEIIAINIHGQEVPINIIRGTCIDGAITFTTDRMIITIAQYEHYKTTFKSLGGKHTKPGIQE